MRLLFVSSAVRATMHTGYSALDADRRQRVLVVIITAVIIVIALEISM